MTLDLTKPVQTRSGHKARIICTDRSGAPSERVVALIIESDGREEIITYALDGFYYPSKQEFTLDLINVPESVPDSLERRIGRLEYMMLKVLNRLPNLLGDE